MRNDHGAPSKKTITGFEPAGGWTVFVKSITAIAVASANAILHHSLPNVCKKNNPIHIPFYTNIKENGYCFMKLKKVLKLWN